MWQGDEKTPHHVRLVKGCPSGRFEKSGSFWTILWAFVAKSFKLFEITFDAIYRGLPADWRKSGLPRVICAQREAASTQYIHDSHGEHIRQS